jgi:DNA-binding MarR family transcriptional regulator
MNMDRDEGFFYEPAAAAREVLESLRLYRAADTAMRRRTRASMGMGENELLAVRFLLRARRRGVDASPKQLSDYLGISSASTTLLIDRLERSGHVERASHPTDRRSIVIAATDRAESDVRATLGDMHERMLEAAEMTPEESVVVLAFLARVRDAIDGVAAPTLEEAPARIA